MLHILLIITFVLKKQTNKEKKILRLVGAVENQFHVFFCSYGRFMFLRYNIILVILTEMKSTGL